MNFQEHEASRSWVLTAIDRLCAFAKQDPDFHGDRSYQLRALGFQRQFVEDGKYRVVFLGAFNVGKSSALNAFLGGAYVPMDIEECTSRLTFIQRGDTLRLKLLLRERASSSELEAIEHLFSTIPATVTLSNDGLEMTADYGTDEPDAMRRSLEPLVTVMADEDFPQLEPLRERIQEINLFLPSTVLEEDIVFVDTPGVHSVSETRQEITYGIIEHSHLVLTFVESGFVGNIHDLNFIKRIISLRGKRVFFVLNKSDRLDSDEIDVRGMRGPAWTLIQAFKRHDIPEDSEIFFLSGYRALRAQQLEHGQITLQELLDDNRLSLPLSVTERVKKSDNPVRDLAAYLMGQSRLPHLKERLMDYLLNENKAGAVIETASKFIWEHANGFLAGIQNELRLAKDPSLFDELRANREKLLTRLDAIRERADHVLSKYTAQSRGGRFNDKEYPGYAGRVRAALTNTTIQQEVVEPLLFWLREGSNLKDARTSKFKTLSAQMEHQVDTFITGVLNKTNTEIEAIENEAREAIAEYIAEIRGLRTSMIDPGAFDLAEFKASVTGSYASFGAGGALVGAAAGAAVGSVVPVIGTAIGAGLGGLIGAVTGFIARLAWSEDRWIKKLEPILRENALNMILRGGEDHSGKAASPILKTMLEYVHHRAESFQTAVREEVANAATAVKTECDDLIAREAEIRREREAIIARLEPKADALRALQIHAESVIAETVAKAEMTL
jgi:hypothetical protein